MKITPKHSDFARLRIWLRTLRTTIDRHYGESRLREYRCALGGLMPTGEDTADLILAACDDKYFQRYAGSLLSSLKATGDNLAIHLHLLRPSMETVAQAEAMRLSDVRFSFTIDQCDNVHPSNPIGLYYTAARFILAPLLLSRGIKRLLIIDVDSVMRKSPWPIIDGMPADTAAGFIFRPEKRRAWQHILAVAVLFTAESQPFANRLARALLVNLSRPQQYHIDQIIPHYLIERSGAMRSRIKSLPRTLLSLEYADDAAIWTAKGKEKHSDEFATAQQSFG
jgi:hypothetical protein